MRVVYGQDAAVAHWVACAIPHLREAALDLPYGGVFGPAAALGVVDEAGRLLGGVVYHNHSPYFRSIDISCASLGGRWLTAPILRVLLNYPFRQLNCIRATSVTPRKSDQPRRFLERLGFKREGVARYGFGDDHAVIYGLLAREWARHPLAQERAAHAGAVAHGQAYAASAHAA